MPQPGFSKPKAYNAPPDSLKRRIIEYFGIKKPKTIYSLIVI